MVTSWCHGGEGSDPSTPLVCQDPCRVEGSLPPVLPLAWQPPLAVGGPDGGTPPPRLSGSCWLRSPSSWERNVFPLRASRRVSGPGHLDPICSPEDSMEGFNSSAPHPPLPFNSVWPRMLLRSEHARVLGALIG